MGVLFIFLALGVILAVAAWQIAPRYNRTAFRRAKPGSIWLHDPTGNIVPEDEEFDKPDNEGDLL